MPQTISAAPEPELDALVTDFRGRSLALRLRWLASLPGGSASAALTRIRSAAALVRLHAPRKNLDAGREWARAVVSLARTVSACRSASFSSDAAGSKPGLEGVFGDSRAGTWARGDAAFEAWENSGGGLDLLCDDPTRVSSSSGAAASLAASTANAAAAASAQAIAQPFLPSSGLPQQSQTGTADLSRFTGTLAASVDAEIVQWCIRETTRARQLLESLPQELRGPGANGAPGTAGTPSAGSAASNPEHQQQQQQQQPQQQPQQQQLQQQQQQQAGAAGGGDPDGSAPDEARDVIDGGEPADTSVNGTADILDLLPADRGVVGAVLEASRAWVTARYAALEAEMAAARSRSVKSSARVAQNALASLCHAAGEPALARRWLARSRDNCSTQAEAADMCWGVVAASLEIGDYATAQGYATRISAGQGTAATSSSSSSSSTPTTTPSSSSSSSSAPSASPAPSAAAVASGSTASSAPSATSSEATASRVAAATAAAMLMSRSPIQAYVPDETGGALFPWPLPATLARGNAAPSMVAPRQACSTFATVFGTLGGPQQRGVGRGTMATLRAAALKLCEVGRDPPAGPGGSAHECAVALAVLACATLSRAELATHVIASGAASGLLDRSPAARALVSSFHLSDHPATWKAAMSIAPHALAHPFLAPHAAALLVEIRRRALASLLTPYSVIQTRVVAEALVLLPAPTSGSGDSGAEEEALDAVEEEIISLIESGDVSVRIDAADRVVRALSEDPRDTAISKAIACATTFATDARFAMVRANIKRTGIAGSSTVSGAVLDIFESAAAAGGAL